MLPLVSMYPLRRLPGFVVAMVWLAVPPVHAQTVETGVFGGFAFGGAVLSGAGDVEVPLEAGFAYGGTAAVEFLPSWRFEALVMRQESQVRGAAPGTRVHVNVDRYMGGVRQQERLTGRLDIFGEFMLGATRFAPAGFDSETWFTLGAGAGVKTYVARHLGFRFEARGYYTPVSLSGRVYCGPNACLFGYTGAGTFQGDLSAGVLFAF
jgi:hypothetical protein